MSSPAIISQCCVSVNSNGIFVNHISVRTLIDQFYKIDTVS